VETLLPALVRLSLESHEPRAFFAAMLLDLSFTFVPARYFPAPVVGS
jgi:hypothetical protein